jgi:hypothetical protein
MNKIAISRQFLLNTESWAITDFLHVAKSFRGGTLNNRLSEQKSPPCVEADELRLV